MPIRPVEAEEAIVLKNILGRDVSDFVHEISNYDLAHAIKRHSDDSIEATRGQVAITPEDLKKIPEIISDYDAIRPGSVSSAGRKSVIYEKRVNGNIFYVEVVHQGKKTLLGKTMWKEPSRNLVTKNVPQYTSEIEPGLSPSASSLTSDIIKGNDGQGGNFKRGIEPLEIQAINYGLGKGSIKHAPDALNKPEFTAANLMTKALSGSEVIPYTGKGFGGIHGFSDGRRVYLNANSKQPMLYIAGHELVHNIESANPEAFARLSQIIREHVADNAGLSAHYAKMGYAAKDIPKGINC